MGDIILSGSAPGGTGGGNTTIVDGADDTIKATVLDLTDSNPLTVAIVDANGDQITSFGSGTVTVNNGAGAAAVNIQDGGNSITVDNPTLSVVAGGAEATALRVTIANNSTGLLSVDDNGSSLTVDGATTAVPATTDAGLVTRPLPRLVSTTGTLLALGSKLVLALDGRQFIGIGPTTGGAGVTSGTIEFEVSYDGGTTYWPILGQPMFLSSNGAATLAPAANHIFENFTGYDGFVQYLFDTGSGATHFQLIVSVGLNTSLTLKVSASDQTNSGIARNMGQGAPATLGNAWAMKLTDTVTGPVAVKAASTLPLLTDKALVTTQRDPLPAGTNSIGVVSSKTDLTPSAPAVASVGVASAQAVAANANRKGLVLVNTSNARISLGLGAAAVLDSGITLYPGGTFEMDEYLFDLGAVNAIASAAASNLGIQELTT